MASQIATRRLIGLSWSSVRTVLRSSSRQNAISFHSTCHRQLHSQTSLISALPTNINEEERRKSKHQLQPYRSFHATSRAEIAPFLPEVVIAAGIIGGWVVYRTSQGKPLTPDDALERQEAYKKQEEALRRRQPKWLQERESR